MISVSVFTSTGLTVKAIFPSSKSFLFSARISSTGLRATSDANPITSLPNP